MFDFIGVVRCTFSHETACECDESYIAYELFTLRGDEAGDGRSTERAVSHAEDMHSFAGDTSVVLLYTGRLLLSSRKH